MKVALLLLASLAVSATAEAGIPEAKAIIERKRERKGKYIARPVLSTKDTKELLRGTTRMPAPAQERAMAAETVDNRLYDTPIRNQGAEGLCHDDQTEVLTNNGWKLFCDVTDDDLLATVDPKTCKLSYEKPSRLICLDYSGPMIYGKHKYLDFAVTPDHQMLVRKWDQSTKSISDEYVFVAAKDLGWYSGLMAHVVLDGGNDDETFTFPDIDYATWKTKHATNQVPMRSFLQFLGLYLADGTLLKNSNNDNFKIQIAGKKDRKREMIVRLAKDLGLHLCELEDRVTFSDKRMYETLERMGLLGVKAPQKFVPEFVFSLSARNIEFFLEGHFCGDGCMIEDRRLHYTSSSRMAEDLQRLIFLTGDSSNIAVRQPRESQIKATGQWVKGNYPEHKVSVCEKQKLSIDRNEHIRTEHYDGAVFCAEMPTHHTLVTRRNGKILVAGNCTAFAVSGAIEFLAKKNSRHINLSEKHLWMTYQVYQTTNALAAASANWITVESAWPYANSNPVVNPLPRKANVLEYRDATTWEDVYASLREKRGVILSAVTNTSWSNPRGGVLSVGGQQQGGHAIAVSGYFDTTQGRYLIIKNSWGPGYGSSGYVFLPEAYCATYWCAFHVIAKAQVTP